jgi:hypothetical protein
MRHRFLAVLAACSVPFVANPALAAEPAPQGTVKTVKFKVTVQEKTKGDWDSTAIARVLNAQCQMVAAPASAVASTGMTAEQEAAVAKTQAEGEALTQQMQPSMGMTEKLAAEAEKCGEDEACLTALAMQLSQDPEFQAQMPNIQDGAQKAQKISPDLGPVRYQLWQPQSCTGEMQANDTYVHSDPGGEGGDGAYTDTTTVKGSAKVDTTSNGLALFIETDTVGNTTQYRLGAPVAVTLPSNSSMSGAGTRQVDLLATTKLPEMLGPYKGVLGQQKGSVKGESGSVAIEWSSQ